MNFLFCTILLVMAVSADAKTVNITDLSIRMTISAQQIHISENITDFACTWGPLSCFVQCDNLNNVTHLSSLENESIQILTSSDDSLIFNFSHITCNVTRCVEKEIKTEMDKTINSESALNDLAILLKIKGSCETVFTQMMIQQYISVEKKYIHNIISLPFTEQSKDYDFGKLAMTVFKMNTTSSNSNITAPQLADLEISVNTWIPMEPFLNVSELESKVGVITYASSKQFVIRNSIQKIGSPVIRIEVVGRIIKDLKNLLTISFSSFDSGTKDLSCQYFDDVKEYVWKQQDPHLINKNDNYVTCSYDHMTPFAVLLVDLKIDKKNSDILSYITYAGCILSAVFSAAAIFVFAFKKGLQSDYSNRIHVSLSGALFLLNVSFMFNEIAATWSKEFCVFVAVVIQYSLLCSFSWMAIEAMHLYLLLVKVFNTYIRHYMIKVSLFGWGFPALIVGVSLCVYNIKEFYGAKNMTFTDTSEVKQICWITDTVFFYGLNLTYFIFMFLMNTGILSSVTCQICKLRNMGVKNRKLPSCKDVGTVLCLTCLLGLTWGLAFFNFVYENYPILYLFCICNSLQGFFMFLWLCRTLRRNRHLVEQSFSPAEHSSNSNTGKTSNSRIPEISYHS